MKFPKHTCISCAYLFEFGEDTISTTHREWALDDKMWNSGGINYQKLVCHMGKQNYSEFNKNNKVMDIRNEVIKFKCCKDWTAYIGISPTAVEQRKSAKWAKPAFWVAVITLVVVLTTWILGQFVFKK